MKRGKYLGLGCAEVKVVGFCPEKFINVIVASGLRVWDIVTSPGELCFKTDLTSLKKLFALQKQTGYVLEVQKKSGLLIFAHFFWQRKFLLFGFICFWLILYYLSGMVWQLDMEGIVALDRSEVQNYLNAQGLEKWSRIRSLDLNAIEQQLYVRFPEIAWLAIERSGTKISIRIVEKQPDPLHVGEPIDIVAEYDGIISEVMVIQGHPLVEPGMTVAKGDVLISGYHSEEGVINGAGYIKAIVYIEGYGEAALEEIHKEYTGTEVLIKSLRLGKRSIFLSSRKHGFIEFEIEESIRDLRGGGLPIQFVEQHYREIVLITKVYTPVEADQLAQSRAMILAHQQVGEHADLLKTEIINISLDVIYRYQVILTIETKIGKESQSD